MTVTTDVQSIVYDTDGSTAVFPIPFYFLRNADITAELVDDDGGLIELTLGTDFTVTGAGQQSGGALTATSPFTAGYKLHVYRVVPVTQETQFQQNDPFPSKTTEKALDKLTMLIQQQKQTTDRALVVPRSDLNPHTTLPPARLRANKGLGFDNAGNPVAVQLTIGSIVAPVVESMAMARLVSKLLTANVFVTSYYGDGKGGGGAYVKRYDVAPAGWENGGTQFVAADGAGWELQHDGTVSDKHFGVKADGVTDDTAALQAALSSKVKSIYMPAGVRLVTADLVRTGNTYLFGDTASSSIIIMGGNSTFRFAGNDAGGEYNVYQLTVERVGFRSNTMKSGDILYASWVKGIGGTSKTLTLRDCEFLGVNGACGFTNAVHLYNARNVTIDNVRVLGDRGNAAIGSSSGFLIEGEVDGGAPVEIYFKNTEVYYCQFGYTVNGWVEGVYWVNSGAIACRVGIQAVAAGAPRPLLSIDACHFNTDWGGVLTTDFVQIFITNTLFYANSSDGHSSTYYGVTAEVSAASVDLNAMIDGNTFMGLIGGIPKYAIQINGRPGTEGSIISRNRINAFTAGIFLGPDTSNVLVTGDNVFNECQSNYGDQGANNIIAFASWIVSGGQFVLPDGTIHKFGQLAVTLNANGDGSIIYPVAFPRGFFAGSISNGDPSSLPTSQFIINNAGCSNAVFAFSVRPNPGAVTVRVNYTMNGN